MRSGLIEALRRIRAVDAGDTARVTTELLEIVAAATASTRVALRSSHSTADAQITVANEHASRDSNGVPTEGPTRIEIASPAWTHGGPSLVLECASGFGIEEVAAAEILGGEVLLRLAHRSAADAAVQGTRQVELLKALTSAGAEVMRLSEVADRAATEILTAFQGANVLIHVLVEGQLDLIARRLDTGGARLDSAPDWVRRVPVDGPLMQAVAAREKKILSRPVTELNETARLFLEPLGVRHLLVAPLLSNERVVGTLSVAHRSESPWPEDGLRLLETGTSQLGVALAQLALLEEERRRASDLALINELGAVVAQQHELGAVLSTAVHQLARLADVPRVHLVLANAERTALVSQACTEQTLADMNVPIAADSAASHAFRTQQIVLIDDAISDPRVLRVMVEKVGTRSVMAVPLISRGESIGAIVLVETRRARKFTKEEVARAIAVANLLSPTITNAKMFDDLRRSYDALARAQAELVAQARLAALGQLSAVIAHEVRNPLAVIYNSLGSLRRIAPATADATLLLDIVAEEAARLNRIVGDLLDFVKPYSSHPRPARLGALLQGAVDGALRATQGAVVRVQTDIAAPDDEVIVDGTMVQQALINLVVNAIQASPKDGSVTVHARRIGAGADSRVCYQVIDEGPGVDAADAERIFEPFFTSKATGTGLGLAVVRRIADALQGRIEVGRAASGGSIFTLTIPVLDAPEPEQPSPARSAVP